MSIFTQTTTQAMNNSNAAMAAAMAMMPNAQTCQNQHQASQSQQAQRQPQAMRTHLTSFTKAENNPVFCFFYSFKETADFNVPVIQKRSAVYPIPTPFTKRPEEILNHAHKGGARI